MHAYLQHTVFFCVFLRPLLGAYYNYYCFDRTEKEESIKIGYKQLSRSNVGCGSPSPNFDWRAHRPVTPTHNK